MASQRITSAPPARASHGFDHVAMLLVRAGRVLIAWQARARQRARLADLDERMLRDIGLTRAEAEAEFRKAPWQL